MPELLGDNPHRDADFAGNVTGLASIGLTVALTASLFFAVAAEWLADQKVGHESSKGGSDRDRGDPVSVAVPEGRDGHAGVGTPLWGVALP